MKWPRLRLSTLMVLMVPLALLLYWASKARHADALDNQVSCYNNFSNMGVSLLCYLDSNGHFPTSDANGPPHSNNSPRHSWRTRLEFRYDPNPEYDFSLPWNTPQNLRVAHKVPWGFYCRNNSPEPARFTNIVAWTDHGVSSLERANAIPKHINRPNLFIQLSPKAADFILLIEYPNSDILWTEPRDLDIKDLNKLSPGADPHGLGVLFADGHVERLPLPELRDRLTLLGLPDPSPTSQPASDAP